ncbi:MAG: SPOR domain-containing protein [Halieaceae bacterium]|nr:SPOR domain-containing protein [Halieaceae bacterium]
MTRDFANKGSTTRGTARTKPANASRRQSQAPAIAPWPWFLAGLLCGVFLSGLVWLASQRPDTAAEQAVVARESSEKPRPRPRFDFYTLLPEQRIDVDINPEAMANTSAPSDEFLLQAGSFKQAEDADRRRAQLLLLGLTANVEEATTDNGRWFRVYIGPFESRSALQSARNRTAQEGIDTLLLKRPVKPAG